MTGIFLFGAASAASWAWWLVHYVLSHRTSPIVNAFRTPTSVVVPAYREAPEVLLRCLRTWLAERPMEIILVVDLADEECLRSLAEEARADQRIRLIPHRHLGKRDALGVGIRSARGEIVVLADSDTSWQPGLLAAVQMPFSDPSVGGVGTRQNVYQPAGSVWRLVADWLLDLRYSDYVPAMSSAGGVICLSGRTVAYRRSVLLPLVPLLEEERFLGRRCVSGDDGRLTWLVLSAGYRTVHQDSARALSMFPDTLRGFWRQRLRWSRNSYRCYLTAIAKGWAWRLPVVSRITMMQIMLTPISMSLAFASLAAGSQVRTVGSAVVTATVAVRVLLGRLVRGTSHLRRRPGHWWLLPVVAGVVILVALPVKALAFVTMNRQGWLTREPVRAAENVVTAPDLEPV